MDLDPRPDFSSLFGAMWRVFTQHYALLLGYGIIAIVLTLAALLCRLLVGTILVEHTDLSPMGAALIGVGVGLVVGLLLIFPVLAYLYYTIVRHVRGAGERAVGGRYGQLIVLSLLGTVLIAPGELLHAAGNPDQVLAPERVWTQFERSFRAHEDMEKARLETGANLQKEQNVLLDRAAREEADNLDDSTRPLGQPDLLFQGFGLVLLFAGELVALMWLPWAYIALLDPRAKVHTVGGALAEGRRLARRGRGAMVGVAVVTFMIFITSLILFCFPGIFFGYPLAMAFGPGLYMAMRGESGDNLQLNLPTA